MNLLQRIRRHARLTAAGMLGTPTPPFFILFINSICNQKCDHCFYWRSLNQRDDLTQDEIFELSRSLGRIENLNLSGGEPFLRKDFSAICQQFIQHNGVRQIYVPTNGYFTDRIIKQVTETLQEPELELFAVELSLDGTAAFHDEFRHSKGSFERSMATYRALAELQERDPRLRIHATSTATETNLAEIRSLTAYLFEHCPKMDHHNLAIIRGDRKNPSLVGPTLEAYQELFAYIQHLWRPREEDRYGALVEPLLQTAKIRTARERRQVVPCTAGNLTGVVYANGDVSLCEQHLPVGNLRQNSFPEIWNSPKAQALRDQIAQKSCHCTTEVFLWPSIVFQPLQLAKTMLQSRPWRTPAPLGEEGQYQTAPSGSLVQIEREPRRS